MSFDEIPPPIGPDNHGDDTDKLEKEEPLGDKSSVDDFWAFDEGG